MRAPRCWCIDEGSALIELAIGLPVAFLMTFGFIYFTMLVFGMGNNVFASRAAVRYASLHSTTSYTPTTQAALNAIVANYSVAYPSNTITVTCSYGAGGNTVGQVVSVDVIAVYTVAFLGNTYGPLTFTWVTNGVVTE